MPTKIVINHMLRTIRGSLLNTTTKEPVTQALPDSLPPRTRPRLCKATTPSQFLLRYCENNFLGVTRATKVLKEFQTLKHCIYAGFPELRRYLNGSCDNPTTTVSPSKVDKQCFVDMLNSNI